MHYVFARFVSNADRIGADDVLTGIDAPVEWRLDWRWSLPILNRAGRGVPGSGLRGIDPLVRFKYLLIGQWHPEA
ncbi:MAG: hypothetical protein GDA36_12615 [Rhodobacteraceae bacterium]|nr:hypothetical protein [Paracoccaceae bacterium]